MKKQQQQQPIIVLHNIDICISSFPFKTHNKSSERQSPNMIDLVGVKIVVLVCLGMIKLISGLMPLLLGKFVKKGQMKFLEDFMAGVMCIGGGVLLATVFIHMLPEVRESLIISFEENDNPDGYQAYPFAELTLCAGFFTIYLVNQLLF
jgi:zinc transporter 1/2/3